MSYIGVQPTAGQYRKLDDISASFNGSTTSFTTSVGGTNVTAGTAQQLLVSVGGVIQEPDADYTVSTNTITFTTAPASGLDFFAVLMGDALNTVSTSDGSITTAKLAGSLSVGLAAGTNSAPSLYFTGDSNTGVYSPGADQVAVTTGGTQRLLFDAAGQIEAVSLGTASAPTYSFTTDPNTGVYSPGADQLAITTGGTGRLFVDSSGRVGLGTSSPATQLQVVGTTLIGSHSTYGASSAAVSIYNGSSSANYYKADNQYFQLASGTGTMTINSSGQVGIGTTTPGTPIHVTGSGIIAQFLTTTDSTGAGIGLGNGANLGRITSNGAATNLAFEINGTERARLDTSGRLGIGTTSPSYLFDAQGDAAVGIGAANSNNYAFRVRAGTSGLARIIAADTSDAGYIDYDHSGNSWIFRTSGSEACRIDSSQRLLVGTSTGGGNGIAIFQGYAGLATGAGIIHLQRGSSASSGDYVGALRFTQSDTNQFAEIAAYADGATGTNDYPGRLTFSVTRDGAASPTESARITNKGFFRATTIGIYANNDEHEFISNTNDKFCLRVQSNATNGNQFGLYVRTTDDQNDATRKFIKCDGDANERFAVRTNGGVANYSANNVNLSDRNVKKNIAPAAGTWDCLKEWEIVNFRYKDQPDDADLNMGVIAQQVAESCPEVITVFQEAKEATETEPAQEERLGVKDQQMMWMAIKALQEAQLRIETLEAEVAALKGA